MWTWAPEGNAGAATRTATKLWNDPEYNNLRSESGTDRHPNVYPGSYVEYVQKLGHEAPGIYS